MYVCIECRNSRALHSFQAQLVLNANHSNEARKRDIKPRVFGDVNNLVCRLIIRTKSYWFWSDCFSMLSAIANIDEGKIINK